MRLSPRFDAALVMAAQLHAGQTRKGGTVPYIAHLLAVTAIVLEAGGGEDEAIAALLHDVVEDQGGAPQLDRIRGHFGDGVAEMVAACTDSWVSPKPPWRDRKQSFLDAIHHMPTPARLVVLADKLHNVRSLLSDHDRLGEALWQHFHGGRNGTLWYYRAAADAFAEIGPEPLAGEFARAVAALEAAVGPFEPRRG